MIRSVSGLGAVLILACSGTGMTTDARWLLDTSFADRSKFRSFDLGLQTEDPFERALASRAPVRSEEYRSLNGNQPVDRLKSFIALAEAGRKGYDAVHMAARQPPPRPPTQMTIAQIEKWIRATPRQPHAIGRYQIIPSTLAMLKRRSGLDGTTRFSPAVQDHFADILLSDAKLQSFLAGKISRTRFMDNLARIWAGLPTSSGKSHYDGYAGNRATVSRSDFQAQMVLIFN